MRNDKALACYSPSTVFLIDDQKKYLLSIKSELDREAALYRLYSDPVKALNFLMSEYKLSLFPARSVACPQEELPGQRLTSIDVRSIREEIYSSDRFDQISVIVIDQEMPGLKGLEFCRQIHDSPIKKIMLTGEVDNERAIKALNEGLIDHFINKKEEPFTEKLNNAISEQQYAYFRGMSSGIISSLTNSTKHCMEDPAFFHFIKENILKKKGIFEYYLLDTNGSMLFVSPDGNLSILAVSNEESMETMLHLATHAEKKPPESVIRGLKNREMLVYLHTDKDLMLEPSEWASCQCLHKASLLNGDNQKYYYSYIENPSMYDLKPDKVVSFRSYLERIAK